MADYGDDLEAKAASLSLRDVEYVTGDGSYVSDSNLIIEGSYGENINYGNGDVFDGYENNVDIVGDTYPSLSSSALPLTTTEEMECPQNRVGLLIGSKGSIIQEIMRRSGCKIVIYQDGFPEGQPRKVAITGPIKQVQIAKKIITSVITEGPSSLQPGQESLEPPQTQYMPCPHDKVGLVIGAKGAVIQDIMRRSGCKITINQNFADNEPRVVVIVGRMNNIDIARSLISTVIANGPAALVQVVNEYEHSITDEMDCPQEKVGIVIGAKGSIVQDIMRRCGCKIMINQDFPDGQPRRVIFSGTHEQVEAGKQLVQAVIAHGPSAVQQGVTGTIVQEIKILQAQVGKMIGPMGSTIKDIQQRFRVKITVDQGKGVDHVPADNDERSVKVTGDFDAVHGAIATVWQILEQGNMTGQYGMQTMQGYNGMGNPAYFPTGPQVGGAYPGMALQGMPIGQGLGADGTAGRLMPATMLPNGLMHQVINYCNLFCFSILFIKLFILSQVVFLLKVHVGRIAGKAFSTLALITSKSGANVHIDQNPMNTATGQELCKINVIGPAQNVSLAGQMIQEVCTDIKTLWFTL